VAECDHIWFPEPVELDDTFARRGERTADWLARSTVQRAVNCRRFMNANLSHLDPTAQAVLFERLKARWHTAFFELVVARTLQALGATVATDPVNRDGRRPDFMAVFPDSSVVVEATVPVINGELGAKMGKRIPLLDFIEDHAPEGWSVGVSDVPDLGPADSKAEFKAAIRNMLDVGPPVPGEPARELAASISNGDIRLTLVPTEQIDSESLLWETGYGYVDDTRSRVLRAVRRKRAQVRSSDEPALLAVNATGLSSRFEAFDQVLLGASVMHVDVHGSTTGTSFSPRGEFARRGSGRPTYAGVLAYTGVGFHFCNGPILYVHPRHDAGLPAAFQRIEQRHLDPARSGITVTTGVGPPPAVELGLVDPDA